MEGKYVISTSVIPDGRFCDRHEVSLTHYRGDRDSAREILLGKLDPPRKGLVRGSLCFIEDLYDNTFRLTCLDEEIKSVK